MAHLNVEIKAWCPQPAFIKEVLHACGAEARGLDHQIDTYFRSQTGRLKLREGNIENSLIFYERENKGGPKDSKVALYEHANDPKLKEVLAKAMGVLVVVDKAREIYFIRNVKFHLDEVKDLGKFVEIEAIDRDGMIGRDQLQRQCANYVKLFGIKEKDLISESYSDMLLKKQGK